jgi:dephospho-CoA kinase
MYVKSLELPLLVIEHPLMFELYQQDKFDYIIGVHCGRKIRVDRMKNRGYDPRTIKQRMAAQIPFQQNARHCDLVINTTNNPTEEYVIQQLQDFTQVKTLISESSVS